MALKRPSRWMKSFDSSTHAEIRAMLPFLEHLLQEYGLRGNDCDAAMAVFMNTDRYYNNGVLNLRGGLRPAQAYIIDRVVRIARENGWRNETDINEMLCALIGVTRHEDGNPIMAVDWCDSEGFNYQGVNRAGYNQDGYNADGYDCDGYNKDGIHKGGGFSRQEWARVQVSSMLVNTKAQGSREALLRELRLQINGSEEEKRS